jgi:excisionase family DNA binding protein
MADQTSSQPSSAASTENGLGRLLYRVDEIRRATALSRADVYRRINAGEIPHVRVGRSIRIPARGLQEWLRDLERNAA